MIYDSIENIEIYCEQDDPIYKAVAFAGEFDTDKPDGTYPIEGDDIFAIVQSVTTENAEDKLFEAHQDFIDVQFVLDGCERQDVYLLDEEDVDVVKPYDAEKDVMFFKAGAFFSTVILRPGQFVVYGPQDGHCPCCLVSRSKKIRKVCVKIRICD